MTVGGKLSFRGRPKSDRPDHELSHLVLGGDNPPRLEELVDPGFARVEIEIGPGKGGYIKAQTAARPDTFLLGIEAAASYAELAATKLAEAGQENGKLLVDNGKLFLEDRVAEASLDRLHVYFPDPWPKRRHRGRRFFTEDTPELVSRVLKPDGYLLVATDNARYAGQIGRILGGSRLLERDPEEEAHLIAEGPGHGFSPTDFERKYIAAGRIIRRWAFRNVGVQ